MNHFEEQTVFDCIVCGSGPAGLGASMAAAKLGARVLVLESAGQPGGTICAVPFMPVNRLRTEKKPRSDVHEAFVRHLTALGSAACYPGPEDRINGDGICPHPEYAELAIYNMLEEAGVTLKLFSPVVDVETAENSLCAVITREKRGLVRYRARVFCRCNRRRRRGRRGWVPPSWRERQRIRGRGRAHGDCPAGGNGRAVGSARTYADYARLFRSPGWTARVSSGGLGKMARHSRRCWNRRIKKACTSPRGMRSTMGPRPA